jgi:hypothetical protein
MRIEDIQNSARDFIVSELKDNIKVVRFGGAIVSPQKDQAYCILSHNAGSFTIRKESSKSILGMYVAIEEGKIIYYTSKKKLSNPKQLNDSISISYYNYDNDSEEPEFTKWEFLLADPDSLDKVIKQIIKDLNAAL